MVAPEYRSGTPVDQPVDASLVGAIELLHGQHPAVVVAEGDDVVGDGGQRPSGAAVVDRELVGVGARPGPIDGSFRDEDAVRGGDGTLRAFSGWRGLRGERCAGAAAQGHNLQRVGLTDEALAHDGAVVGDAAREGGRIAHGTVIPETQDPARTPGRGVVDEEGSWLERTALRDEVGATRLAEGAEVTAVASPRHVDIGAADRRRPGRRPGARHQGCPVRGLERTEWLRGAEPDAAHLGSLPVVGDQQVVVRAVKEPDRRILGRGNRTRNLDDPLVLG